MILTFFLGSTRSSDQQGIPSFEVSSSTSCVNNKSGAEMVTHGPHDPPPHPTGRHTFCRSSFTWRLSILCNTPLSKMAKRNRSASPSNTPRAQRAIRRLARESLPTVPPPTAPRGLSTLSTDTTDSLTSLDKDARVKIQAYENQSLRDETLLKSGLNAFLTWLPEAGRTSIARDVIETSSDRELYDVFMNLFTGLAAPSKYVPFKSIR